MVNRYTVFQPQQYVETYVPLPLDFINQQGAMKQADLDKHRKELESDTDPLSKIGDLSFSLKAYDREGNIIDKSNTELENYKKSQLGLLYSERDQLANDLASGKIDDNEFKRRSKLHINKASKTYNELASYKSNIDAIKKANEEYAKSKEFGLDPSYGTDMLEYNTEYLDKASKGIYDPYSQQAISDKFDMQKAVLEFKFKDEGGETVSIGEYITKNGWNGVTKERVKAAASQIFNDPNSDVNRNAERVLRHQMRLNPEMFKSNEDVENYYNQLKDNFIQSSILEHAGIVEKADAKNNSLYNQQRRFDREDELAAPLASTGPGEEVVGISNIKNNPRFSKYINDDNSIAWDKLFDDSRGNTTGFLENVAIGMHNTIGAVGTLLGFGWGKDAPGYKEANDIRKGAIKDATDFENAIGTEMRNIAKTTGYTKPVTVNNYDDLLKYAENYSKFRGLSLEYHDNEQKVYSNRLNEQKQSYTYFDASTGEAVEDMEVILDPKNKLRALGRTSRPVEGKGAESVLRVQDSKGKIYYARERDNEATRFFDEVFNVNNAGLEYNRTGKLQNYTDKRQVNENKVKTAIFEALNELGMDIGYDVAAISYNPSNKKELYVTVANPRNKSEQMMVRMDAGTYKAKTTKIGGEERALVAPNEFMSKQNQNWALSHWGGALRGANKTYETSTVEENENENEETE